MISMFFKKVFLIFCSMTLCFGALHTIDVRTVYAQEQAGAAAGGDGGGEDAPKRRKIKPPVMKSIFWNTLLGSGWGALIGVVGALSQPGFSFNGLRESVVLGTTFGGLVGYGMGVFLVLRGISFDPSRIPMAERATLVSVPVSPRYPIALRQFDADFQIALRPSEKNKPLQPVAVLSTYF